MAATTILSTLIPSYVYIKNMIIENKNAERIPFFPIVGGIYGLYFGLPLLFENSLSLNIRQIPIHLSSKAQAYSLLGWWGLMFGYYLGAPIFKPIKKTRIFLNKNRAKWLAIGLIFAGGILNMLFRYVSIPGMLRQPLHLLADSQDLGVGILVLLSVMKSLNLIWNRALWLLIIPIILLINVGEGSVGALTTMGIFIIMIVVGAKLKIPWFFFIVILVATVLFRGNIGEYREEVWYRDDTRPIYTRGAVSDSIMLIKIVHKNVTSEEQDGVQEAVDVVKDRTNHLAYFAHVIDMTPEYVPFWNGESYLTFPISLIPRAMWPTKPSKNIGQVFGHRYGFLFKKDKHTSINCPLVVEAYMNYGIVGVFLIMLFIGLIYRFLLIKFTSKHSGGGSLILGAFIMSQLVNIESDFSVTFGYVLQGYIVYFIIIMLARQKRIHVNDDRIPDYQKKYV